MLEIYNLTNLEWKNFVKKYDYNYTKLVCISNFNILLKKIIQNIRKFSYLIFSSEANNTIITHISNIEKILNNINSISNETVFNEIFIVLMDMRPAFNKYYSKYTGGEISLWWFFYNYLHELAISEKISFHLKHLRHKYKSYIPDNSKDLKDLLYYFFISLNDYDTMAEELSLLVNKDHDKIKYLVTIFYILLDENLEFKNSPYAPYFTEFLDYCCEHYSIERDDTIINENLKTSLVNLTHNNFNYVLIKEIKLPVNILDKLLNRYNSVLLDLLSNLKNIFDICEKFFSIQ